MSQVTMTEATGLNLFVVTLIERQGEYENQVKRLVRADNIDLATMYVFAEGLPAYYGEYEDDPRAYGELDEYNCNQFFYNCGDRAVVFKHIVPVDADKVQAVEIASNMGLIDFM